MNAVFRDLHDILRGLPKQTLIATAAADLSDDEASIAWARKHRATIRFHHARGMSRAALIRIYGFTAVARVLG